MDINLKVLARMVATNWDRQALAIALRGKVPKRTIYSFTMGAKGAPLNAKALGDVLDVLGLVLYPKELADPKVQEAEDALIQQVVKEISELMEKNPRSTKDKEKQCLWGRYRKMSGATRQEKPSEPPELPIFPQQPKAELPRHRRAPSRRD